jgi:aerobic carbon-monoxide dehydrogenase large subunit
MLGQAVNSPGVVAVYAAADLGSYWRPGPLLVASPIAGITLALACGRSG